jgi:uncharacterized protein YbjT (DUF2867 family)
MHMKITVIGATGGIGGHVVRQALDAGHHVTAVVRDGSQFELRHPALEVVRVPGLTEPGPLMPALDEARMCPAATPSPAPTPRTPSSPPSTTAPPSSNRSESPTDQDIYD